MAFLLLGAGTGQASDTYIKMGNGAVLLGQPTVNILVYTPDDPATTNNELKIYGPDLVLDTIPLNFLLDTGANGLMISRDPYADINAESNLERMKLKGFEDHEGSYLEQGVGGFTEYGVSGEYDMDFISNNADTGTLEKVRFMCDDVNVLGDFAGIMGMPTMLERVTVLDMTPWLGTDLSAMSVGFLPDVPVGGSGRYNIPLTLKEFEQSGQVATNDPLPSWAPLPFVQAYAGADGQVRGGDFLMDTGAQLSMISSTIAFGIGLDSNGDEILDDNDDRFSAWQQIGGVGGTTSVPTFMVDSIVIPTTENVDLQWQTTASLVYDEILEEYVETNVSVTVMVLDITDEINGIVGMDLIHSGWTVAALGGTNGGAINTVYYNFHNATSLTATMAIDLGADWNSVIVDSQRDADGDIMPDAWEQTYFGHSTNASDSTDSDNDGFLDAFEYLAGTEPTNAQSLLAVVGIVSGSGTDEFDVTWQAVTNKTYRILHKRHLTDSAWVTNRTGISGVYPLTTKTIQISNNVGFVKVLLE